MTPGPGFCHPRFTGPLRRAVTGLAVMAAGGGGMAAEPPSAWAVAGRQGLVQAVIVPAMQAADQAAYDAQIERLCAPETTCFLNFYTNSSGAPAAVPLPDAIAAEATATFRRSMKNGRAQFRWACRVKPDATGCF